MSSNESERPQSDEAAPERVRSDGTASDDGHETGGGHDGMGPGPTGS